MSSSNLSSLPRFDEDKINVSVDLTEAAKRQIVFLKEVDRHRELYSGPLVKNAIRRYEQCWLPLAAEYNDYNKEAISPPLDIQWIWHCHMLAPYYYEKDCLNLVNKVVDHKVLKDNAKAVAFERARKLWNAKYKFEPFDMDLDSTNTATNGCLEFQSRCKYDLEIAISRQKMFFYQVSLPHYKDDKFLRTATTRYKKYLFLKKNNMDLFLVPCYDFDLVWHSHQLHPLVYKRDTAAVLGKMFNHDDSVNERSQNSKLNRCDTNTRELWKKFFTEEFALCGAMFRGDPPFSKLHKIEPTDIFTVFSKHADVTINSIKLQNMNDEPKFTLKVALRGRSDAGSTLLKLKGPQKEWQNNSKGIAKFRFDTGHHSQLHFDLIDKKGFLCFGSNKSFGMHNYPFSPVVESTPDSGKTVSLVVPLVEGAANGLSVAVSAMVEPPQRGPCILSLQAGQFQSYTMPENIEQLWGPIPLPKLPDDVPNTCIVANHR